MSDDPSSSVIRLIRVSAVACAIVAATAVYFSNEPRLATLSAHLDETRAVLRSDDIVLSTIGRVRAERDLLRRRYARLLRRDVEATFIGDLDANVRRHAANLISTTVRRDSSGGPDDDADTGMRRIPLTIELRGSYRNLLDATADLSNGNQIVDVRSVSLRRADNRLIARIPVVLFEADAAR
jgi:Tfp pilus assembly protein PilO